MSRTSVLVLYPGMPTERQRHVRAHAAVLAVFGLDLVLADDEPVASDRECFAEVVALPQAEDVSAGLAALEEVLARRPIHAVVAQSESALGLGSIITRSLGLPGISPAAARLTMDKHACRVRLAAAGVSQPHFVLARSAADVRAFVRVVGLPVVLKGVASALGRLVTLVEHEHEIDAQVARLRAALPHSRDIRRLRSFERAADLAPSCDSERDFLVESFAHGDPVETDGLSTAQGVHSFGVTEQVLSPPPFFYMEGYLLPADRPQAELVEIERTSAAALRALGVEGSGYSVEMRAHQGRALVIEVNGRLGWDEGFGDMFAVRIGVQPMIQALLLALGRQPPPARAGPCAAIAYRSCYTDARVVGLPTAAQVAALAARHDVRVGLAAQVGERYFAPPYPDVFPHVAWALATDARSSRAAYARARAAVDEIEIDFATAD